MTIPFLSMVVADVMTENPLTIEPRMSLGDVRDIFHSREFDALPVVEDRVMVGWVTQFDLLRVCLPKPGEAIPNYDSIMSRSVEEIMHRRMEAVTTVDTLARVLHRMLDTRFHSFPVIDVRVLLGVIAREDILNGLMSENTV